MNRVLEQGNHLMVARVRDDERARLDEIAFELLYEDHAGASERALIGDLLVKAFGWRHRPTRLASALRRRSMVRELSLIHI